MAIRHKELISECLPTEVLLVGDVEKVLLERIWGDNPKVFRQGQFTVSRLTYSFLGLQDKVFGPHWESPWIDSTAAVVSHSVEDGD